MKDTDQNLQRKTLQKLSTKTKGYRKELIDLRLQHSYYSKYLNGYIKQLTQRDRIYPRFLPTQASFRWSTIDPPLTNWPRQCINTECPGLEYDHEWTERCFSLRDILLPDQDEVMIVWDHDNIEGRIHDLITNDTEALTAHSEGYDLHTITCCNMFNMALPHNLKNPHTSEEDMKWRQRYNWQGKDTKQRVLAKNFNHGSKYTKTWRFVYKIEGIEKYGINHEYLGKIARNYIRSKQKSWDTKIAIMEGIQRSRISRTLYGGRRIFFDGSDHTAKEGFSHMISGTVSDYNNISLITLEEKYDHAVRVMHNAHDGNKIALKKDVYNKYTTDEIKEIIERDVEYQGRKVKLTAGVKVYGK